MELDESQEAAVQLAGDLKGKLVSFASSPPFQRPLRRILRETMDRQPELDTPGVFAVEELLFGFRYDDGSTVVDRFLRRPDLSQAEQEMAVGFTHGVEGYFEILAPTPAGASAFRVRCCLSDLEHIVAPTEPAGIPAMEAGAFIVGRLNPVAGTDLWTTSGAMAMLVPEHREFVARAVLAAVMRSPQVTHRDPQKARIAADQVAQRHQRFLDRHGRDQILVEGKDLPTVFAEAIVDPTRDPQEVAETMAKVDESFEHTYLNRQGQVMLFSHPVAGVSFYDGFVSAMRALDSGTDAAPDDLEVLRGYLQDDGVAPWLLRRLILERLPSANGALARALGRRSFDWERDGETLLASLPGDQEPVLTQAITPSLCLEYV